MADTIRQVDYYHLEVPDKPGEGFRVLTPLKEAEVNLLAYCAFPTGGGKAQIDFVPENPIAFQQAAARGGLSLSEPKRAFFVQGEDRAGAVADVIRKLATEEINIVASHAVNAGSGRWGMILWVKPADFDRARKALKT